MMPREMPSEIHEKIQQLCKEGDDLAAAGSNGEAWQKYVAAMQLVPEPVEDWEATTWILATMGDLQFKKPDYVRALDIFQDAVRCAGGLGNVFIHLRLGQCYLELGDEKRAADNLTRAYMGGGREAFTKENPKYFALLERLLKPSKGQDRL